MHRLTPVNPVFFRPTDLNLKRKAVKLLSAAFGKHYNWYKNHCHNKGLLEVISPLKSFP